MRKIDDMFWKAIYANNTHNGPNSEITSILAPSFWEPFLNDK
jgi:hypothetical protein